MVLRTPFIFIAAFFLALPIAAVQIQTGSLSPESRSDAEDGVNSWKKADRQFRASYYYSRYIHASMQGHFAQASVLLQRAAASDPKSLKLKKELAEHYEIMGQALEARQVLEEAVVLEPDDFKLRSKLAHLMVRLGDLNAAREQYRAYLEKNPGHRGSLHALASLQAAQGNIMEALKILKQVLQAYPDSVSDLELYADLLERQVPEKGETFDPLVRAQKAWKSLVVLKPDYANGWYRLALVYEKQKAPMKAEQTFLKSINQLPQNLLLLDGLGRFYYRQRRFKDAERAFNVSYLAHPMDADSLLFLGMSRLQLKKYALAEKDFLKIKQVQQKDSAAQAQAQGLGLALAGQKKFKEAEPVFKGLIKKFPRAVSAYIQLALMYDEQKKENETLKVLRLGIEHNPQESELYLLLGSAWMDQKNFKKAEAAFKAGLKSSKETSALRFQLAVLYEKTDRFKKAEKELRLLLKEDPFNAQALNYLGYAWAQRGLNLKEAQNLIVRALKEEPENFYYLDSLGWVLFKQGRYKEALVSLKKAAKGLKGRWNKEDAVILDHLGDALANLGRQGEAMKKYMTALKLRPDDEALRKKTGVKKNAVRED